MMKYCSLFFLLFILPAAAQNQSDAAAFLVDFLPASYEVVGRMPDSDSLYSGRVMIQNSDSGLIVVRQTGNQVMRGRATIEKAAGGDATVLRVGFVQEKQRYEITYQIHSDLDNYARLSGYVYRKDGSTKTPGLEVLFHKK